jgi:tripartite-type tricarboxylate transporter receptor subunit TctC
MLRPMRLRFRSRAPERTISGPDHDHRSHARATLRFGLPLHQISCLASACHQRTPGLWPKKRVTALATVPTVLVINAGVAARTLDEFVRLAKSQPGKLTYGSAGYGSVHHLTMALFAERSGIDLLHVPYRGGTALVNGLLTGEIQAGWSGIPNVLALIEAGQLRALCISILKRSPSMPAVPTCAELGYDGFDIATMIGLQAAAGLPEPIVARLQAAVAKALREGDVAERMRTLGIDLQENGTAQYRQFMQDDLARYQDAARRLKLKQTKAQ